jgi:hypothetical protein
MTIKRLSLKENDRVKRKFAPGGHGTVKTIRQETTASAVEQKDIALLVTVLWDNGTLSSFSPEGLDAAE